MTLNPFRRLRQAGVLGMNERNARYIAEHNPRRLYPLVDDKLRTKRLAEAAGIAVPRPLAVLRSQRDVASLDASIDADDGFVVKPAGGAGGNGIVVVRTAFAAGFRVCDGTLMTHEQMGHHVGNILSGMYSLGAQRDVALVEQRVHFDERFDDLTFGGVPDIRVVVYRGVPVVAMMRLPTQASGGKANLHLGGVGVGVDMATGTTDWATHGGRMVTQHPDTLAPLVGVKIPEWQRLLALAARCQSMCGLGYLGVDFVLDQQRGPLVLELNARPGLAVQLANRVGLRRRLAAIDREGELPSDADGRARLATALFEQAHPSARAG